MATEVLVPPLGQTVDTVTLVSWYKNEGEAVKRDEPLFVIETDKATLDVEAPASGVLRGIRAQPGDAVKVLSSIAHIAEPDEEMDSTQVEIPPAPEKDLTPSLVSSERDERQAEDRGPGRILISPRARRLAEQHNIPLANLQATGPEGAIIERDVRTYIDAQATPPITPVARRMAEEAGLEWQELAGSGPGGRITRSDVTRALETIAEAAPVDVGINQVAEIVPLRSVRAVIAERMARSVTTTAHVTLTAEADATDLVELRNRLIEDEVNVSYNDVFLYILGRALREHPQLNASIGEDSIQVWQRVHIGLAVDTERGLLVPVVRDVDQKGLIQLAEETLSLVEKARAGQCTPEELGGGTFTLTNLGMFGIDSFTPLINLPECAVLGVGRVKRQPVMLGEEVVGRQMVWLSLTFDHRLVDGAPAARFLQRVVQLVERPHMLIT